MSHDFYKTKTKLGKKLIDLSSDTLKLILVMANSTCPTDRDAEFVADFVDLDEYDGANYARKTLSTQDFVDDATNKRSKLTADDITYSLLGAGTRNCIGALLIAFVSDDSDSMPLFYFDQPTGSLGFPFNGNGGNVPINPASTGWLYF